MESEGRLTHVAVAVGADRQVNLLTGRPAGLVSIECVDADPARLLACVCRLDEVAEPGVGDGFTVAAEAQAEADGLVLDGATDAAVDLLTGAGVRESSARAWTAAVAGRRRAVSVSVARRLQPSPGGPFEAGELRWLLAGSGTAGRVEPGESVEPHPAPWPDVQGPKYAVITPIGRHALYRDLTVLVERSAAPQTADR